MVAPPRPTIPHAGDPACRGRRSPSYARGVSAATITALPMIHCAAATCAKIIRVAPADPGGGCSGQLGGAATTTAVQRMRSWCGPRSIALDVASKSEPLLLLWSCLSSAPHVESGSPGCGRVSGPKPGAGRTSGSTGRGGAGARLCAAGLGLGWARRARLGGRGSAGRGGRGSAGRARPAITSPVAVAPYARRCRLPTRRTTGEVVPEASMTPFRQDPRKVGHPDDLCVGAQPSVDHPAGVAACWPGPPPPYFRMLTARAATSPIVSSDTSDCRPISSLARGVSGIVSVGLNAVADVSDTNR